MLKTGISDIGAATQLPQLLEVGKAFQPGVRDPGAGEVQLLEAGHALEVLESDVRDAGAKEVQRAKIRKAIEAFHACVSHSVAAAQVQLFKLPHALDVH